LCHVVRRWDVLRLSKTISDGQRQYEGGEDPSAGWGVIDPDIARHRFVRTIKKGKRSADKKSQERGRFQNALCTKGPLLEKEERCGRGHPEDRSPKPCTPPREGRPRISETLIKKGRARILIRRIPADDLVRIAWRFFLPARFKAGEA